MDAEHDVTTSPLVATPADNSAVPAKPVTFGH